MKKSRAVALDITGIATGAAFIAVCSWISVPVFDIPYTLQTFGVFLVISLFGLRRGTLSVLTYILIGLAGAPVFSRFNAGPSALFGPTGGYIISFLVSAAIIGIALDIFGKKRTVLLLSMSAGLAACYLLGTLWFIIVAPAPYTFWNALSLCVFPLFCPTL